MEVDAKHRAGLSVACRGRNVFGDRQFGAGTRAGWRRVQCSAAGAAVARPGTGADHVEDLVVRREAQPVGVRELRFRHHHVEPAARVPAIDRGRQFALFAADHIAKYLRDNVHQTIVGPIAFSADGERKENATLMAQFRGIVDKNMEQFRTPGKQVILFPAKWKSGDLISPFEVARK